MNDQDVGEVCGGRVATITNHKMRNRSFIEKYRDAFLVHIAGLANVVFPFGTYLMRKIAKVACEAAETIEEAVHSPPPNPAPS